MATLSTNENIDDKSCSGTNGKNIQQQGDATYIIKDQQVFSSASTDTVDISTHINTAITCKEMYTNASDGNDDIRIGENSPILRYVPSTASSSANSALQDETSRMIANSSGDNASSSNHHTGLDETITSSSSLHFYVQRCSQEGRKKILVVFCLILLISTVHVTVKVHNGNSSSNSRNRWELHWWFRHGNNTEHSGSTSTYNNHDSGGHHTTWTNRQNSSNHPLSQEPSNTNDKGASLGRDTCGSFFQPTPIMALKHDSTVERVANAAVATDMKPCSKIGLDMLKEHGGNAVDAAVAASLCLGVFNPGSSGIGGGAMILVHMTTNTTNSERSRQIPLYHDERDPDKHSIGDIINSKTTEFIDCREVAPLNSSFDMYLKANAKASLLGGLAIGVPGELRGLEYTHAVHGILPWSDVIQPAIDLAKNGFKVSKMLAHEIDESRDKILSSPDLAEALSVGNNGVDLLQEDDVLNQPTLARTLEKIRDFGADYIYKGDVALNLAKEIEEAGGIITKEDLENYRPTLRTPVVGYASGFTVVSAPPPSSGGAAIIGALRFLTAYTNPFASYADTLSIHRLVEASKHVFAIRMSLSDPQFYPNVTKDAVQDLISNDYMYKLRQMTKDSSTLQINEYGGDKWSKLTNGDISNDAEAKDAKEGDRTKQRKLQKDQYYYDHRFDYLNDHGTSHLSVIDQDRNAVSITSTVNTIFGSGVYSKSTGILFNNQMDDFSSPGKPNFFGLVPSKSNYIVPGKKPLSSMSPTMVFRSHDNHQNHNDHQNLGNVLLTVGGSGGPKIISAVMQVIVNFVFRGMPLFESVANARIHDQLLYHGKPVTTCESSTLLQGERLKLKDRTIQALLKRNHSLLDIDYMGTVQAVSVDMETNTLSASSDIRKGGCPYGW